jgi:hypothetical protein
MANFQGIAAAGASIVRMLNSCFDQEQPIESRRTRAQLVRTTDFEDPSTRITTPGLTVFFYRVDFNKTMRAAWSAVGSQDGLAHLPLDLQFLITPWADNAEDELRILGKAMQCLESHPLLSGVFLDASAGWAPSESVQVLLGELSTEEVMRTFDSLPLDYRLSVPYVARIVRIDGNRAQPSPPVTMLVTGITASSQQ